MTVTLLLIIVNVIFSYQGLRSESFFDRFSFRVQQVLAGKEYYRLISSGFLHVSWSHLIFNMLSLYFFGPAVEAYLGVFPFIVVYAAGLIGGDLFALFVHRQHDDYSAAGASGAICGIMFALIALVPGVQIGMIFIPLSIPGWLYGLVYTLYTIYGVRSKADNVGHEAHLGGAMVGMFTALLFYPTALRENVLTIAIISIPSVIFIYIILKRPYILLIDNLYYKQHRNATLEDRYNINKRNQQSEIDAILEKIHKKGMSSLSAGEKEKLDRYSRSR